MINKLPMHYSMTNPATVYEDEGLTALELVGRIGAKMNETVQGFNTLEKNVTDDIKKQNDNIPKFIDSEVKEHIENGDFDNQISEYANGLSNRVDNLLGQVQEGSTTLDAEVIDARSTPTGHAHKTTGAHVRDLESSVEMLYSHMHAGGVLGKMLEIDTSSIANISWEKYHALPNLINPFKCIQNMGVTTADGTLTPADDQWVTELIYVKPNTVYVSNQSIYKMACYNADEVFIGLAGTDQTTLPNTETVRVVYKTTFDKRFNTNFSRAVASTNQSGVGYFESAQRYVDNMLCRQIRGGFLDGDCFVIGSMTVSDDMVMIGSNTSRIVSPYPFYLLKGTTINAGEHSLRVFKTDENRKYIGTLMDTGSIYTASENQWVMISIDPAQYESLIAAGQGAIVANQISFTYSPETANDTVKSLTPVSTSTLTDVTYMSDHCFIGNDLWVFNAGSDDLAEAGNITIYTVDAETGALTYKESKAHKLGHVNSVSYNAERDALICGNGSSDETLSGQIYYISSVTATVTDTIVPTYTFNVSDYGYKVQAVWGESNNGKNNIIYVLTNDNRDIRKMMITIDSRNRITGTSTLVELEHWHTSTVLDVNQGTEFIDGDLYIGLGHSEIWCAKVCLINDGSIQFEQFRDRMYNAQSGDLDTARFTEGIAVRGDYIYIGDSTAIMRVYKRR